MWVVGRSEMPVGIDCKIEFSLGAQPSFSFRVVAHYVLHVSIWPVGCGGCWLTIKIKFEIVDVVLLFALRIN